MVNISIFHQIVLEIFGWKFPAVLVRNVIFLNSVTKGKQPHSIIRIVRKQNWFGYQVYRQFYPVKDENVPEYNNLEDLHSANSTGYFWDEPSGWLHVRVVGEHDLSEPGTGVDKFNDPVEYDAYPDWLVRCNLEHGCPAVKVSLDNTGGISVCEPFENLPDPEITTSTTTTTTTTTTITTTTTTTTSKLFYNILDRARVLTTIGY